MAVEPEEQLTPAPEEGHAPQETSEAFAEGPGLGSRARAATRRGVARERIERRGNHDALDV